MIVTDTTGARARWAVAWITEGRLKRQDYGNDFAAALDIYGRAVAAGKNPTLICPNMAFPPPDVLADREVVEFVNARGKRMKGWRTIEPRQYRVRMGDQNRKGIWWCPHCVKRRRFVKRQFIVVDGIEVGEPHYACPICGITHAANSVRRYNPYADRGAGRKERSDKGTVRG